LRIEASFVRSAASADDLPREGLAELALIGRSNVGKSSLINALTRRTLARTSAAPGKTRLANVYRVVRGRAAPLYLVDLPGYGYARGGGESAAEFERLTAAYFGRERQERRERQEGKALPAYPAPPALPAHRAALLLVDARHPGLRSDLEAWRWLRSAVERCEIVATKIDKLARGERIRVVRDFESVFQTSVLPVSAATGEGLDELWKTIERLASSNPAETAAAPRPPRRKS
jgi:GTP-binding protein